MKKKELRDTTISGGPGVRKLLLGAIRDIFRLDNILHTDDRTHIYGSTPYAADARYLILLVDEIELKARFDQNLEQRFQSNPPGSSNRPARWLSRVAGIDLPKQVADSDKIDKTILVKISSGPVAKPEVDLVDDKWDVVHLNDVLAQLVLGLPPLNVVASGHNLDRLAEPLKTVVTVDPGKVVPPTVEEIDCCGQVTVAPTRGNGVDTIVSWAMNPTVPFLIVFGLGGLGKTTMLKLAGKHLWEGFISYKHSCIPTFVPLGSMPAGATYSLAPHIGNFPLFRRSVTPAAVDSLIKSGNLVVFLDAFDEHLKFANRADAVRFLEAVRDSYGLQYGKDNAVRLLLTSRDYYLHTDRLFDEYLGDKAVRVKLRPFDSIQRREFIRLASHSRDRFSEEQALRWADSLETQVQALQVRTAGVDQLVGHSLFLLAFTEYVSRLSQEDDRVEGATPEEFRLQSASLFDEVIERINVREQHEKSKWDAAVYKHLQPQWHANPFDPDRQSAFFAEVTKRLIMRETRRPIACPLNKRVVVESEVGEAMRACDLVPEAEGTLAQQVRDEVQTNALNALLDFFKNHPLVDGESGGFVPDGHFAFRHETYQDYFVKEYLSQRFLFLYSQLQRTAYGLVPGDDAVLQLMDLIVELYATRLLDRATNALYFLCWDDRSLKHLSEGLRALFIRPTGLGLDPDIFSLLLQYSLLFVKLYRELRDQDVAFEGLSLFPEGDAPVVVSGLDFGDLLHRVTVSLCSLGHIQLSNVTFQDCTFSRVSIRHLGFHGNVVFRGGTLYLIPEDEAVPLLELMYVAGGDVTITLENVVVHKDTMEALQNLGKLETCALVVGEGVLVKDFEAQDEEAEALSPGKRLVNTMMRLMRKHERVEFGAYDRKVLGRTQVPRDRENEALEVLENNGIIERAGNMLIMKDPRMMYQPDPDGPYGRPWDQVRDLWEPLIAEIDQILLRNGNVKHA